MEFFSTKKVIYSKTSGKNLLKNSRVLAATLPEIYVFPDTFFILCNPGGGELGRGKLRRLGMVKAVSNQLRLHSWRKCWKRKGFSKKSMRCDVRV